MSSTVDALNALSVFGPRHFGAYREHADVIRDVLGPDVETQARSYLAQWAGEGKPGVLVLTGNAGTGKTALVDCYSSELGVPSPASDEVSEISKGRFVVKDFSGLTVKERGDALSLVSAIRGGRDAQLFLCANEGVLRDAFQSSPDPEFESSLDAALEEGAVLSDLSGHISILNMNRQRWTDEDLWSRLLHYLVRPEIWKECDNCPAHDKCPILNNAEALRRPLPQDALRRLVQVASGTAVATLRELLSILAYSITGGRSCDDVVALAKTGPFTVASGYFNLFIGEGLSREQIERSSLVQALIATNLGSVADVEIDGWLRDSSSAPTDVQNLAHPQQSSPHNLVDTNVGVMTFGKFGETISISDDAVKVHGCLKEFASGRNHLRSWRRRIFFEAQPHIGGVSGAFARTTRWRFCGDLLQLASRLRTGQDLSEERQQLLLGLNYLSAGFYAFGGGLVVPDPGSLVARNPGSFHLPSPSLIHSKILVDSISLQLEDGSQLRSALDTDDVRIVMEATNSDGMSSRLTLSPPIYEAICESSYFRSPVGSDIPEMTELSAFYSGLSTSEPEADLQIVDPARDVIQPITLPSLN